MKPPSFRWFSPFKLGEELIQQLSNRGALEWDGNDLGVDSVETFFIYLAPHQLVMRGEDAAKGYKQLKALAQRGVLWRNDRLLRWLAHEPPSILLQADKQVLATEIIQATREETKPAEDVSALSAILTLRYFEEDPSALDCYLDLELRSKLENDEPDLQYALSLRSLASFERARDSHLQLCSQNDSILADCIALTEENKQLAESVARLNDDFQAKESSQIQSQGSSFTEIHRLHAEIEHILSAHSDLSHQNDSLAVEIERERLSSSTLEETHASERIKYLDEISILELEVNRLREVEETLNATLNEMLASQSELRLQATSSKMELDRERSTVSSLQDTLLLERNKYQDETSFLESEINRLRETEETLNLRLNEILASQSELCMQVTSLRMELDSERTRVSSLQDELASERDRYRLEIEALGIENEHLQAEVIRFAESVDPLLQEEIQALAVSAEHIEKLQEAYSKIDEILSEPDQKDVAKTRGGNGSDRGNTLNKDVTPAAGKLSVVEVAPITTEESLSVEVQALLASYRSSLKLAYELLEASRLGAKG